MKKDIVLFFLCEFFWLLVELNFFYMLLVIWVFFYGKIILGMLECLKGKKFVSECYFVNRLNENNNIIIILDVER